MAWFAAPGRRTFHVAETQTRPFVVDLLGAAEVPDVQDVPELRLTPGPELKMTEAEREKAAEAALDRC